MGNEMDRDLAALAGAYRRVRAPATLAATLRAEAESRLQPRRSWLWPAAFVAAGAVLLAVGLGRQSVPVQPERVAIGLPSMSQLKPRTPGTSLSGYRLPSLGKSIAVPTLPRTPRRGQESSRPAADTSERDAKS